MQTNFFLQRYFLQYEWDKLKSKTVSLQEKLMTIWKRKEKLGDVFCSEMSEVHSIAILELAARDVDAEIFDINPQDCYTKLSRLKDLFKQMRKKAPNPHFGQVTLFPETPDQLKNENPSLYHAAYPGHETDESCRPVASQVDEAMLQHIRIQLPARRTHNSILTPLTLSKNTSYAGNIKNFF